MGRKTILWLVAAMLVCTAMAVHILHSRRSLRTAIAETESRTPVQVVRPERRELTRAAEFVGAIEPWEKAALYAQATGYVERMYVDRGDRVAQGQVLAVLSVPEMEQELHQYRAAIDDAEARRQEAVAELRAAEADVERSQAELRSPQAAMERAGTDVEAARAAHRRTQAEVALSTKHSAQLEREYEAAQSVLAAAEAEYDEPAVQLAELEAGARAVDARIEAAEGEVNAAQAEVGRAKADLVLAETKHGRFAKLRAEEGITEMELDQAKSAFDEAKARGAKADAQVQIAQARLRAAKRDGEAAQAKATTAKARIKTAEKKRQAAQQQLAVAQARLESARAESRLPEVSAEMARLGIETARKSVEEAEAQTQAAGSRVKAVKARAQEPQARLRAAQARQRSAEAALAEMTARLGFAQIRAPFDGVVTERHADPGALIDAVSQARPLFTVMNVVRLRVFVEVPERDVPHVKVGNLASIAVKELAGQTWDATVARIAPALTPETRTMKIEINLDKTPELLPGMYAHVRLSLDTHYDALTIPAAALVMEKQTATAFVVRDGCAEKVELQIGIDDGQTVEVLAGLKSDEPVVVVGQALLKSGMPVEATPWQRSDKDVGS